MDEVEAIERMTGILDAAVHVSSAGVAGAALDHRRWIDDLQLVAILEHRHVLAWHDRDNREGRPFRFPALGAAAGVVVGDVALDADFNRPIRAFADQRAAGKSARAFLDAIVDRWVELDSHRSILLVCDALI